MAIITEVGNPSNRFSFPTLRVDEFLPFVEIKPQRVKDVYKNTYEIDGDELSDTDEEVTLSEYLMEEKRTHIVQQLTTERQKFTLTFTITKAFEGFSRWDDDDGYIGARLAEEDKGITITHNEKMLKKYGETFSIEVEVNSQEAKEFYIDFYANDNEDYFQGDYEDVFCGRVKIVFKLPNIWVFTDEKIEQVKQYAISNEKRKRSNPIGGGNHYHHCTDTHKHIVLQLLNQPKELNLGKDQDHEAPRPTPKDFEKAGESTTTGVRNTLIAQGYAEPSKVFTVIDIDNNEVVKNGKPFNTQEKLSGFKESPVEYLKSKCPTDGNYVFVGAYNADYHSFTIVVAKKGEQFQFLFIDQRVGVENHNKYSLEQEKLLYDVYNYRKNFPLQFEVYQIRNKKQ